MDGWRWRWVFSVLSVLSVVSWQLARAGVAGQPQLSPHNLLSYLTITATVAPATAFSTANI